MNKIQKIFIIFSLFFTNISYANYIRHIDIDEIYRLKVKSFFYYRINMDNPLKIRSPFYHKESESNSTNMVNKKGKQKPKKVIIRYEIKPIVIMSNSAYVKVIKYKNAVPVDIYKKWIKKGFKVGNCRVIAIKDKYLNIRCGRKYIKSYLNLGNQLKFLKRKGK